MSAGPAAILSVLFALICIVCIIRLIRANKVITRKNSALAKEIKDNIALQEKNQKVESAQASLEERKSAIYSFSDVELFNFLRDTIVTEQLYLDPTFDRQKLITRFLLSKERIGSAFSKGSDYASMIEFVNELRLTHSAKLLASNPKMSINEVAKASGFSNINTFDRVFKQRYSMTPTEFKEQEQPD